MDKKASVTLGVNFRWYVMKILMLFRLKYTKSVLSRQAHIINCSAGLKNVHSIVTTTLQSYNRM